MSDLAQAPLPLDAFSSGRLDRIAPRLRTHAPAGKNANAFHEQWLGLAEPDAAPAVPERPAAYLVNLLAGVASEMPEGDLLVAWESARAAIARSTHRIAVEAVRRAAATVGPAVAGELAEVHGRGHSDEVLDWNALGRDLAEFLSSWGAAHAESHPARASVGFLAGFAYGIARRHRPSLPCRQLMVLKLENHLHRVPGVPAGHFRPTFEAMFQGLARWHIHGAYQEARHGSDETSPDLLTALATLKDDPDGVLLGEFVATLGQADFETGGCIAGLLDPSIAEHLEPLRRRFEANEFDGIDAIRRWATEARAGIERAAADLSAWDDNLGSLAEDLAQGMKGKDTAQVYHQLFRELLARAAWFSLLAPNAAAALDLLVRHLTAGAGMEPQGELWKKHPQITASLQNLLAGGPGVAPWRTVRLVLSGLEQRLQEARGTGFAWAGDTSSDPAFARLVAAAGGGAETAKAVRWLLARAPIEVVLGGRSRLGARLRAWSMAELWPATGSLPGADFRRAWGLFLESIIAKPGAARPVVDLAAAMRDYGRGLPAATAAEKIRNGLDSIAASIVDRVFAALPDYAASVGESGAANCRADNLLTLRKVSELLTQQPSDPVEALSEWWNAVVGGYLKNRTGIIFEQNLLGIYHSLGQELDPDETEAAFAIIQEVYRRNFGVDCRAARSGQRLKAAGPFGRRILRLDDGIPAAAPDLGSAGADPAIATLAARHLAAIDELGETAVAAGRILGPLGALVRERGASAVASSLLDLAADLRVSGGTHRLRLAGSVAIESLAGIAAGLGLAHLLGEHRDAVAVAVSRRLAAARPELFSGDRRDLCRRDQSLVLEKWTELFASETPDLAMLNGLRYQVELLGPYIKYGEDVFTLTWTTVEEVLSAHADPHVMRLVSRWVSRQIAAGGRLGRLHDACQHVFDPRGYVFSAREADERTCRDLVGSAMVLTLVSPRDAAFGDALLSRLTLADPAGSLLEDRDLAELRDLLGRSLGNRLPASARAALDRVLDARAALGAIEGRIGLLSPLARAAAVLGGEAVSLWTADAVGRLADGADRDSIAAEAKALADIGAKVPGIEDLSAAANRWLAGQGGDKGSTPLARRLAALARADRALGGTDQPSASLLASADSLLALASGAAASAALDELGKAEPFSSDPNAAEALRHLGAAVQLRSAPPAPKAIPGAHESMFAAAGTGAALASRTALRLVDETVAPFHLGFGPVDFNHAFAEPALWSGAYAEIRSALAPLDGKVAGLGTRAAREIAYGDLGRISGHAAKVFARCPADRANLDEIAAFLAEVSGDEIQVLAASHLAKVVKGLRRSADLESVVAAELSAPILAVLDRHAPSVIAGAYRQLGTRARRALETGPGLLLSTLADVASRRPGEVALARRLLAGAAAAADRVARELGGGDSCRRDQTAILEALGGLLVKLPASTTALLLLRDWVFAFLPHLVTESAREAAAAWRRHEETFGNGADPEERAVLLAWSHLFASAARRLGTVAPAVTPAFVKAMHTGHGELSRDEIRELIGTVAASLLGPDRGPFSGRGLLARGLLRSSVSSVDPAVLERVAADFLGGLDRSGVRSIPGFTRRLGEVPGLVAQFAQLASVGGSASARAAIALSHHGDSPSLWRLAVLARFEPGVGLSGRDPVDALAPGVAGWRLPEDRELEAAWQAHRRVLRLPETLAPAPTTRPGGLFGLIVPAAEKLKREVAGDAALARENARLLEDLSVQVTLGVSPATAAASAQPGPVLARRLAAGQSEAVIAALRSLAAELPGRLGDHHPAVEALAAFADRIPGLALAARLESGQSQGALSRHLAQVLRGHRDAAGALATLEGKASERTPERLVAELRRVQQQLGELPEAEKVRFRQLCDAVQFEATA